MREGEVDGQRELKTCSPVTERERERERERETETNPSCAWREEGEREQKDDTVAEHMLRGCPREMSNVGEGIHLLDPLLGGHFCMHGCCLSSPGGGFRPRGCTAEQS